MKTRMFHAMIAVAALSPAMHKQLRYEATSTGITTGDTVGGELHVWHRPYWQQEVFELADRFGVHVTSAQVEEVDA